MNQPVGCRRYLVYGVIERVLVGARGAIHAAQFPNELQRRGANLVVSGWRLEVGERLDVSAHLITHVGRGFRLRWKLRRTTVALAEVVTPRQAGRQGPSHGCGNLSLAPQIQFSTPRMNRLESSTATARRARRKRPLDGSSRGRACWRVDWAMNRSTAWRRTSGRYAGEPIERQSGRTLRTLAAEAA